MIPASPAAPPKPPPTLSHRLKNWFLAGMLVVVPAIVAIWAVQIILSLTATYFGGPVEWLVTRAINPEGPWKGLIPPIVQVVSLLLSLGAIIAIGWLSAFLAVRKLIRVGEALVERIPVIKFFYSTPKEVLSLFTRSQEQQFSRVVMMEYPAPGVWAIGFATAELRATAGNDDIIAVFMPTTPNPTTGFLVYLPPARVRDTNLTFEEAFRVIMSGGILSPGSIATRPYDVGKATAAPPALAHEAGTNLAPAHTT